MSKVKTHIFNGVKYSVDVDEPFKGSCHKPDDSAALPEIVLPNGLPHKNQRGAKCGLITILEESLHAEGWDKKHETINRVAKEIGSFLWRLGYRRIR